MTLSNNQVIEFLNSEVVPYWETVRPVPKVTIDFGDGHKLERTLAGNTVFNLCLPDGRVVDAYPGVYTPADLLGEVRGTLSFLKDAGMLADPAAVRPAALREWHQARMAAAVKAERIRTTFSKAVVESPLLAALKPPPLSLRPGGPAALQNAAPNPAPDPKAALALLTARIEDLSKEPSTVDKLAARYAGVPEGQRPSPEKLGELAVQTDSRLNVSLVRGAVHLLFAAYDTLPAERECRDAVYREILHVPVDDPFLGLAGALVPGSPARAGQ